mgnify:CR=1 FL=1
MSYICLTIYLSLSPVCLYVCLYVCPVSFVCFPVTSRLYVCLSVCQVAVCHACPSDMYAFLYCMYVSLSCMSSSLSCVSSCLPVLYGFYVCIYSCHVFLSASNVGQTPCYTATTKNISKVSDCSGPATTCTLGRNVPHIQLVRTARF